MTRDTSNVVQLHNQTDVPTVETEEDQPTTEGESSPMPPRNETNALRDLVTMLTTKRPHDTPIVKQFAEHWLRPLGAKPDTRGNWWLRIPRLVGERKFRSKVMWSSHLDTVHNTAGTQKLAYNEETLMLSLASGETSNCLGADCTTGVWIMREMALARVPGLYIWHEGEEAGGLGSRFIVKSKSLMKRLDGITSAIAFDRKGYTNIITEQSGGVCASKEFALSLAEQLPGEYKPDPTGLFTDTANYADDVAECTNISVGYFNQHYNKESQDLSFALDLRRYMVLFDETKLQIVRKPGEGRYKYGYYGAGGNYTSGYRGSVYGRDTYYDSAAYRGRCDDDYTPWQPPEYKGRSKHDETRPVVPARERVGDTKHMSIAECKTANKPLSYLVYPDLTVADTTNCGGLCGGNCLGLCSPKHDGLRKAIHDLAKLDDYTGQIQVTWSPSDHRPWVKTFQYIPGKKKHIGEDELEPRSCRSLLEFVKAYPAETADFLEQWGLCVADLYDTFKELP